MIELLKSIGWTTEQWALFISIIALISTLILNIVTYRVSQNALKLELRKYEEERAEKSKQKLEITVWQSSKYESNPYVPLKWLGLWLIINNRGTGQPLLAQVNVVLHFIEQKWINEITPKRLFDVFFTKPQRATIGFPLYSSYKFIDSHFDSAKGRTKTFNSSDQLPLNFYLIDWDEKKPIYFAPQEEFRMPEPGTKKTMVFLWQHSR